MTEIAVNIAGLVLLVWLVKCVVFRNFSFFSTEDGEPQ